jgi:hypothetical protein
MITRVYITVDTENSMGGAWDDSSLRPVPSERIIFCRRQGRDFGIGWMCGLLNERKLRATFFCETLAALVLGEADTRAYLEFLLEQGQDVQLHAHPNYLHYADYLQGAPANKEDALAYLPLDHQRRVLSTAMELFERFTGCRPLVYRAGNFQGGPASLAILRDLGFVIDSSYNPAYATAFDGHNLLLNVPQFLNGVWELPFTVAHERFSESSAPRNLKYFDPAAMSCSEMRQVLEQAHRAHLTDVVVMLHSFSGVKRRDEQYSSFRPDHIVRRRFAWLLDYLAANSARFTVTTMGEVALHLPFATPAAAPPLPELGWTRPFLRKLVQGVNRIL